MEIVRLKQMLSEYRSDKRSDKLEQHKLENLEQSIKLKNQIISELKEKVLALEDNDLNHSKEEMEDF